MMLTPRAEGLVMRTKHFAIAIACAPAVLALPAKSSAEPNIMTCVLEHAESDFKGTCRVPCSVNALAIDIDGPNPKKACEAPPRPVSAMLREANGHWLGTMEGKFPEDPTRFEVLMPAAGKSGVAKTPYGWFSLQSAKQENNTLTLTIAANNQLPPTPDDIRIIQRAEALLSPETWNRADSRTCPPNPQKWSLFCALQQATQEISGGLHYRQPALQMVREVLNEVGGARLGKHRLMDYNNHPDTTLSEIHDLLRTAETRLTQRLH
jgi:hypothetical protein